MRQTAQIPAGWRTQLDAPGASSTSSCVQGNLDPSRYSPLKSLEAVAELKMWPGASGGGENFAHGFETFSGE